MRTGDYCWRVFWVLWMIVVVLCNFAGQAAARTVTSIAVEPVDPHIDVGAVQQFRAVGTLDDGTSRLLSPVPSPIASSGYSHTCAVLTNGTVKCWGYNYNGELGTGAPPPWAAYAPVLVEGIDNATGVATGFSHSCAVLSDGTVKCWGDNGYGQIGNGSTADAHTPVPVSGIHDAIVVAGGRNHTCALLSNGTVQCWGYNSYGQLGVDRTGPETCSFSSCSTTPVLVPGITNAVAVAAGDAHTCALNSDGTVQCWGWNFYGQCGNGDGIQYHVSPVTVSGINNAVDFDADGHHTCALLLDGTVKCWGYNNYGLLGDGTVDTAYTPVSVAGINTAKAIAAGGSLTCALLSDGTAKCWGFNQYGGLGDGTYHESHVPVSVSGIHTATGIAAGYYHACAVLDDGTAWCWGYNTYGALGDGTGIQSNVPVEVDGVRIRWNAGWFGGVADVAMNGSHVCARLFDGTMKCWGDNSIGQLGIGDSPGPEICDPGLHNPCSTIPIPVTGITASVDISPTCSVLSDGSVRCWGDNDDGQLGNGTTESSRSPVSVNGISTALKVAEGASHACAALSDGTVKCWGDNFRGQLGTDPASGPEWCGGYPQLPCSTTPVSVNGINTASDVAAGTSHSCALLSDGTVKCWGYNVQGELGDGTTASSFNPVSVRGIDNALAIAAGSFHTCVLLPTGDVACWGENSLGQLGSDDSGPESCDAYPSVSCSRTPILVSGIDNAIAVAAGGNNTCAILSDRTVKCWGDNSSGQLGDGTTTDSYVPVTVNGITNAVAIGAGRTACAVHMDGGLECWGLNGLSGMLGIGTIEDIPFSTTPVRVVEGFAGSIVWSSSRPAIATIGSTGLANGLNDGLSTIRAGLGAVRGSTFLTVGTVFELAIMKNGTGSGTVASLDGWINCGQECKAAYGTGTGVTLVAIPDEDSLFSGWSGDPDCADGMLTMDADKTCTATFTRMPRLSVHILPEVQVDWLSRTHNGTGRVTSTSHPGIDCGHDCSERYTEGTTVTLEAMPDQGSVIGEWSQNCPNGVVDLGTEDVTCTVRFDRQGFRLIIQRDASSRVSSEDEWIECGTDCSEIYEAGAEVPLRAYQEFWLQLLPFQDQGVVILSGDPGCSNWSPLMILGLADSFVITMDADKTCTASFRSFDELFDGFQFDQVLMLTNESEQTPQIRFEKAIPRFIRMRVPVAAGLPDDPVIQALDFLDRYKYLFRLTAPKETLYLKRIKTNEFDAVGGRAPDPSDRKQHLFFGQLINGIPVHGATLAVHMRGDRITSTSGNYLTKLPAFTLPAVQASEAEAIALDDVQGINKKVVGVTKLFYYNRGLTATGGGSPDPGQVPTKLAWRVMVRGLRHSDGVGTSWKLFINAQDGTVLSKIDELRTHAPDKNFDIQSASNTESDCCWAATDEAGIADWFDEHGPTGNYPGPGGDAYGDGQNAYDFAHLTYDFYHTRFGRHSFYDIDSFWGTEEAQVDVWVHVGNNWRNASYRPHCDHLTFGEGYVTNDIFAHEYTHAVTRWSADLEYETQSGALNESYSDVLAALLDGDWLQGEDSPIRGEDGTAGRGAGDGHEEEGTQCDNGRDDDGDGFIDEGCPETGDQCGNLRDDDGDGFIDEGCPGSCQDGIDNGLTGEADSADTNCFGRDLANPGRKGDPDHRIGSMSGDGIGLRILGLDEAVNCDVDDEEFNDCGYVHTNSGLMNKAAYLLTVGGVHAGSGIEVLGIGPEKAGRLYYEVLTSRLHSHSQFYDARDETIEQAQEYVDHHEYGFVQSDVCSVMNAFAAVGYGDSDVDCDGVLDNVDEDNDGDGIVDRSDNCPGVFNPEQDDLDGDGIGDRCDADRDGDGTEDASDDCISLCADADCDGVCDGADNCLLTFNPTQADADGDGFGNACDDDSDNDGVRDDEDTCQNDPDPSNRDSDGDGFGNVCDNCPWDANADQADQDHDGIGDACDPDRDGDGEPNANDSCPGDPNLWKDFNGNGIDLACDTEEQFMLSGNFGGFFNGAFKFPSLTDSIKIPISPCMHPACPDWIREDYGTEVSVSLPADLPTRIVDDRGFVVCRGTAGTQKTLRFKPSADSFFRFQGRDSSSGTLEVKEAPSGPGYYQGTRYFLEIYPAGPIQVGQSYPFTIRVQSTSVPTCDGDFDKDRDVDGADLAAFAAGAAGLELGTFASDFGKNSCP